VKKGDLVVEGSQSARRQNPGVGVVISRMQSQLSCGSYLVKVLFSGETAVQYRLSKGLKKANV